MTVALLLVAAICSAEVCPERDNGACVETARAFRTTVAAPVAADGRVAAFKAERCRTPLLVGIADICKEPDFVRLSKFYVDALAMAGHVPVVVPRVAGAEACAAAVARLDVLLLAGGEDVSPERYGAKRSPKCGDPNLRREEFEFALLEAAKARRLPVFGICRGVQMLNVAFGGTLWQDLPSEFPEQEGRRKLHLQGAFPWPYSGAATNPPAHTVSAVAGSRLAGIVGLEPLAVNSHHHQAVQKLAPGFRIAAYAPDGVPEAIECDTYPAAGLQFHPESILAAAGDPRFDRERLSRIFARLDELLGMDAAGVRQQEGGGR